MTSNVSDIREVSAALCDCSLFKEDSYSTAPEKRRYFLDRLCLNTRIYFYLRLLYTFYKTSKSACRGELTREKQILFSNENIRLVENCGGRIYIKGLDNLKKTSDTPVVIIGNHMSMLETALLHAIVRPYLDFTYIIKESLMTACLWGNIMQALDAIPVGRNKASDDFKVIITEGKKRLAQGKSIVIFPQASRSPEFDEKAFNSVGIKLARHARVKVIPMALKTDFLGNGSLIRNIGPLDRRQAVHFEFGESITVNQGAAEHRRVIDFISSRLTEWEL